MRIVLSRLDRLGDLILSTPAIRALRRSFPEAHMSLVCSPRNFAAVEHNPDLNAYIVAADDRASLQLAQQFRGVDIAIALAPRTQDTIFVAATMAHRRLGYTYVRRYAARLLARFAFTQRLVSQADPALCEADTRRPVLHEIDQLLALAALAGADITNPELVLPLTPEDRTAVEHVPVGSINFHLAPRWLENGSSEASVLQLLRDLRIWQRPIVMTYAPECTEAAARIEKAGVIDTLVGGLSFMQWVACIERAACVVTVDTSATHVASAMKRPTVVLFEHPYYALNAREWAPWGVPYVTVRKPPETTDEALALSRQELVGAVGRLLST
jgi:ADP-heptose:LPS heptosyltransferase